LTNFLYVVLTDISKLDYNSKKKTDINIKINEDDSNQFTQKVLSVIKTLKDFDKPDKSKIKFLIFSYRWSNNSRK
jgi:hypothetical protein